MVHLVSFSLPRALLTSAPGDQRTLHQGGGSGSSQVRHYAGGQRGVAHLCNPWKAPRTVLTRAPFGVSHSLHHRQDRTPQERSLQPHPDFMMHIEDLFTGAADGMTAAPIDWDPLRERDALLEVGLLDCRVCPLTGRSGLLLDLRTALQYRTGNAALLVVRGMRSFRWRETPPDTELFNFSVGSSSPSTTGGDLADRSRALHRRGTVHRGKGRGLLPTERRSAP